MLGTAVLDSLLVFAGLNQNHHLMPAVTLVFPILLTSRWLLFMTVSRSWLFLTFLPNQDSPLSKSTVFCSLPHPSRAVKLMVLAEGLEATPGKNAATVITQDLGPIFMIL